MQFERHRKEGERPSTFLHSSRKKKRDLPHAPRAVTSAAKNDLWVVREKEKGGVLGPIPHWPQGGGKRMNEMTPSCLRPLIHQEDKTPE